MKPSTGNLSLRRFCVLMLMLVSYTDTYVFAAPKGGQVVSGTATIQQNGNLTLITAGNRSIINYGSFNIAAGETVRFVQPGANSSVLNRVVGSASPTEIFGSLQANGHVFLINPYGIFFKNGSVINVGGLYAGAGNLADADFTKGKIKFTDLAGDVRNDGIIAADNRIALLGANVINTGSLKAGTGMAMMVSGKDVYVGEKNGNIFVQANGKSMAAAAQAAAGHAPAASGSVVNSGTVAAPRVLIGGGDLYSTAISNSGLLQGRNVTVNAGPNGSATVGGTVDASSANNRSATGLGGSIQVLGGNVALKGATLDASGANGGGSVRVGGDFHGAGTLAHAQTTTADAATTIKADATGDTGNGGTVVLWSDQSTDDRGQISVRGGNSGGSGGAVEISSDGQLSYHGSVDAAAPGGKVGSLLFDPTNVRISLLGTPVLTDPAGTTDLSVADVQAMFNSNAAMTLSATRDIRIGASALNIDLSNNTGDVTFQAGTSGVGSFVAAATTSITAPGRNVFIIGASVSPNDNAGLNSDTASAVSVTTIDTSYATVATPPAVGNGGTISLLTSVPPAASAPAAAGIVFNGLTSSGNGTGGKGGAITVTGAAGQAALPTSIAAGTLNTAAGTGGAPGTITLVTTPTGTINFAAAPTFTGDTSLTAQNVQIAGASLSAANQINGGDHDLTLSLGQVVPLSGLVTHNAGAPNSGVNNLASVGAGGVNIDVASFTTTGSQVYNGPITLSADATLTAGNNGGLTIGGALNSTFTTSGTTQTTTAHTLTILTGGPTQINAPVGNAFALGAFTTDFQGGTNDITVFNVPVGAAVTTVNNGTTTGTGAQTYNDDVRLAADTVLQGNVTAAAPAAGGTFSFARTINSATAGTGNAHSLGLTNTGTTVFGGAVGGVNALASFAGPAGRTVLAGGSVTTSGGSGQVYNGLVTLANAAVPATTTLAAGGGLVTFAGGMDGSPAGTQALVISTTGTTTIGGVGTDGFPLASISTGTGPVSLTGPVVTSGNQAYDGPTTLRQPGGTTATPALTTLTSNAGGTITFAGTLDGNAAGTQALSVATTGATTFGGAVGGAPLTGPLASLAASGPVLLNGGAVTTTGGQTYNGTVTLGQTGTILPLGTTLASLNAGDISLAGGVNGSTTAGAQALAINTAGHTTLAGNPTGGTALASITTDAPNSAATSLSGAITTTGTQTYLDGVSLAGDTVLTASTVTTPALAGNNHDLTLTLSGTANVSNFYSNLKNFTSNGTGGTTITGDFTTEGYQTYGNAVTLSPVLPTLTLTSTGGVGNGGDITFNSTLNGAVALTLNTPGNEIFNGVVGGAVPLLSLTTDAAGATTGQAQFGMNAGSATTNPLAPAGVNVLGGLTLNDGALFQATGVSAAHPTVQAGGAQNYKGAAVVGTATLLQGTGLGALGNLTFGSTVGGAGDLTLAAPGTTTFNGLVGSGAGVTPLGSLTVNAGGAGTTLHTASVTTTGAQTYNSPLTLAANVTLFTSNIDPTLGNVAFGSTISGAGFNLGTSTAGGNTVFGVNSGSVGSSLLNLLTTSANGSTVFNNAGFTTAGTQTYQGPVVVQSAAAVGTTATGLTLSSTGGNVAFNQTVVSAGTPPSNLTVTTGNAAGEAVTFSGAVGGGLAPLNSLTVTSPTIHIDGGLVNTVGAQSYTGNVLLGANTTLVGSTVTSPSGVNAQTHDLTLTLSSKVTIPLGTSFININNFTSNGVGGTQIATNATPFTTTGFQHYDNSTTLTANSTLVAGAGGIEFGANPGGTAFTLNSPTTAYTLTLNTPGPITLNGLVGDTAPLASLTTLGGGTNSLNGGAITTTGLQSYGGPVVLGAPGGPTTLTSTAGGEIDFLSTVNGLTPNSKQLTTSTSNAVVYSGPVGNLAALNQLTALGTGTTKINGGSVTTYAGGQFYQGPVTIGSANTTLQDNGTGGLGALNFNSTLDNTASGTPTLTMRTSGTTTFGGTVGGGAVAGSGPLGNLLVTGGGVIKLNGGSVRSTGSQEYNGKAILGAASTLISSTGSNVTFDQSLDGTTTGGQSLVVNAAGDEVFTGLVGSATTGRLASLTTDNAGVTTGTTRFNMTLGSAAAGVNVVNDVTINDAVAFGVVGSSLSQPTVLTGGSQAYNAGGSASQNTALIGGGNLTSGGTLDFATHDLSVRFGGAVTVPGAFANVGNFLSDGAGGTVINGAFNTGGTQFYGDAVTISGAAPGVTANNLITFNSTLDGNAPLTVTVNGTTGQALFNGLVGNTTPLSSLKVLTNGSVNSGTFFNMDAGTSTSGHGGVNVGSGGLAISGPVFFNSKNSSLLDATHPTVVSTGPQTYSNAAILQTNTALVVNSTANPITFGSTLDGPGALAASSAGNEVFNGPVGSLSPLAGLTTDAVGPQTGQAQFAINSVPATAQAAVRVDGNVLLNDAAVFSVLNGSLARPTVLTLDNGTQFYKGAVTLGNNAVFTSTAGVPTGSTFTGGGQITFNSTVGATAGTPDLSVRTGVGQTQVLGNVNAASLDLGGALAKFAGNVGPVGVFSVEPNGGGTGGSLALGGTLSTTGAQQYNAAVILVAPTLLSAGGNVTFASTVDSDALATPRALVVNTGSLTIFDGPVGGTTPLLSLTTDNEGKAGEGTQFTFNLALFPGATAGVQTVNAVTINDPVTFNVQGSSLTRPTVLSGAGNGTGTQTYGSATTLAADTVLTDRGTGNIMFGAMGTAVGTVDGTFNLTVNTGGDEIFNGLVGSTTPLASLQTDLVGPRTGAARFNMTLPLLSGRGVTVNGVVNVQDNIVFNAPGLASGATVASLGAQTYLGAASVLQRTSLTANSGGILFNAAVDGPGELNVFAEAGNIQFNAPVGAGTPLSGLFTQTNNGLTLLNAGTVTTTGSQYYGATVLGKDTTLAGGIVYLTSTLDGPYALVVSAPSQAIFGGVVGGSAPLTSIKVLPSAGGIIRLEGGGITTTGSQEYGNPVQLGPVFGGNVPSFTSLRSNNGGDITFDSTVNAEGANVNLTLATDGLTVFKGAVGNTIPLGSLTTGGLTLGANGTTRLNGGLVATTGAQTYGNAVQLVSDNVLTSSANGDITFNFTLNGAQLLALNTGGNTVFNAGVGVLTPLAGLTTDAPGATLLDGGQVFVSGAQQYGDAVTLGRNTTLSGVSAGTITFKQTVDGAFALNLQDSSVREFDGAVGGTTPLASLNTDGPGVTRINGGLVNTTGFQSYQSPVALGATTVIASTGGDITFGTVNSDAPATPRDLTVNTPGRTSFATVGNAAPLGSITTDAPGTTVLTAAMATVRTGTTTGAQTYNDAVRLNDDATLTSLAGPGAAAGGNLVFNGTVDGVFTLTLNTGGLTQFNGLVGSATPLAGLTTDNAGAAGEGTQFNMTVGGARAGVVVNGPVTINDAVGFNVQGSSLAQPGILTVSNQPQVYNGPATLGTSTFLTSAAALPAAGAGFTGGGAIAFNSPAGITGAGGGDLYVRSGVGLTSFASTINVGSLDLGGAQATFGGPITLPGVLSVVPNDGGTGGSIEFSGGGLTTAGAQTYRVGLVLGANTVFTSLNTAGDGGAITFSGTVDSDGTPRALTLNTNGDEVFNGLVGSRSALASLTTDAPGPVGGTARFNMSLVGTPAGTAGVNVLGAVTVNDAVSFAVAGSSVLDGTHPTILSGGAQTYNGPASLAADTALVSSGGGTLTFSRTLDGPFNLALSSAGDEVFSGLVGHTTPLASLATDTTGAVGGTARFNMDTAGTAAGANVSGAVTVNDAVSFNAGNVSLANATLPTVLSGGTQTYNGVATLAQNTVLTSTGGDLVFNGRLDGAFGLTTNGPGLHLFNGIIGASFAPTSFTSNGGGTQFNMNTTGLLLNGVRVAGSLTVNGTTLLNVTSDTFGPTVLTVGGGQTYNGAVSLARDATLSSSGDLVFTNLGTINNVAVQPVGLTLSAPGNTIFNAPVGSLAGGALQSLTTDAVGSTLLNGGAVLTVGNQTYGNHVVLQQGTVLTSLQARQIQFGSNVNGAFGLVVNAGNEVFNGRVGDVTPLTSLTTDAAGTTASGAATFNVAGGSNAAPTVLTTGAQTYNDGLSLTATTVLTSQTGAVTAPGVVRTSATGTAPDLAVNAASATFGSIADQAGNVAFAVPGLTSLNGDITAATLLVGGGTTGVRFGQINVQTTGVQSYLEPVTLAGNVGFTSTGGLVTLAMGTDGVTPSLITGGASSLTLAAPAATVGAFTGTGAVKLTVGGLTNLYGNVAAGSLLVDSGTAGSVALFADRVAVQGDATFSRDVSLEGGKGSLKQFTAGNTLDFGSITGKQHALTAQATNVRFGQIKNLGDLISTGTRTTTFRDDAQVDSLRVNGPTVISSARAGGGNIVSTNGNQDYRGTVTLGSVASLNSHGNVTFTDTVSGPGQSFGVTAGGDASFQQISNVGDTAVQAAGTTTFQAEIANVASLRVNGGQRLDILTRSVGTTGDQTYGQPVNLATADGGGVALTSNGGAVTFGDRLDGARDLTVDAAGLTSFQKAVGGGTGGALRSLTVMHDADITGGSVSTTGAQTYHGAVGTEAADGTSLSSSGGNLVFDAAVTGRNGDVSFRGVNVLLHGNASASGGRLDFATTGADSSVLQLDGTSYTSDGEVTFLGDPNTQGADFQKFATVVLTNPNQVTVTGTGFDMGQGQKLIAAGSLSILVGGGTATVGDLAARQSLRIQAGVVDLRNRLSFTGSTLGTDSGLNFVAKNSINFGGADIRFLNPENQTANFVTLGGNATIVRRTGLSIFRNPEVDRQFAAGFPAGFAATSGVFILPIPLEPVGGGSQTLDTAAAISGALPDQKPLDIPVDVTITASQMEELRKLGIHPRKAQRIERVSNRRALFAQLVDGEDPDNYGQLQPVKGGVSRLVPSDYVVVVDRMSEREVQAILAAFERLYGKNKENAPTIGAAYQKAFDEYSAEKQTADPAGFSPYLKEKAGHYPDVDKAGRGFDNLFGYIEHMGLTPVEVTKAESFIVSDLNVNGPTPDDMVKVINQQRKNLPPEQRAPSTKVPPAPPVSAPGPAVSPAATPAPRKADGLKTARARRAEPALNLSWLTEPFPR